MQNTAPYNSRGFTIAELMVAIVLTALVIVVAMSFFIYQTTHGREATKTRASRESLSLTMLMLRQDIMHAGYGVSDKRELAVYMATKTADNNAYTELYVNNALYLTEVFTTAGFVTLTPPTTWQSSFGPYDIGCLISDVGEIATLTLSPPDQTGPPYTYAVMGGAGSAEYAPAISYKVESNSLMRNGKAFLSSDPSFRVTGFRVVAMFYGKAKSGTDPTTPRQRWSPGRPLGADPGDPVHDLNQLYPEDLRLVEAMIQYQLRTEEAVRTGDTESGWSPTFSKTVRVSPRTLTLAAY